MRLLVIGLCAIATLAFAIPQLGALLIFDRAAVNAGQWWRLLSGSFAHLSSMHLLGNMLALLASWLIAKRQNAWEGGLLVLITSAGSGVYVLYALPDLRYFGGLSGVATALFVYTNLRCAQRTDGWQRSIHQGLVLLVALKSLAEMFLGTSAIQHASMDTPFSTIPAAHVIGIVSAFGLYICAGPATRALARLKSEPVQAAILRN